MSLLKYIKNKSKLPILATGLAALSLSGCNQRIIESEPLFEDAKVIRMEHKNSYSTPEIKLDFDGDLSLKNVDYPEENIVEFDGKVDFKVDNKDIYGRFREGDSARVCYKETYMVTLKDIDNDGKKEQTDKQLTGRRFLDAKKE